MTELAGCSAAIQSYRYRLQCQAPWSVSLLRVCIDVSKAQISALEPFTVSVVCPKMTMIMSLTAQTTDPVHTNCCTPLWSSFQGINCSQLLFTSLLLPCSVLTWISCACMSDRAHTTSNTSVLHSCHCMICRKCGTTSATDD